MDVKDPLVPLHVHVTRSALLRLIKLANDTQRDPGAIVQHLLLTANINDFR